MLVGTQLNATFSKVNSDVELRRNVLQTTHTRKARLEQPHILAVSSWVVRPNLLRRNKLISCCCVNSCCRVHPWWMAKLSVHTNTANKKKGSGQTWSTHETCLQVRFSSSQLTWQKLCKLEAPCAGGGSQIPFPFINNSFSERSRTPGWNVLQALCDAKGGAGGLQTRTPPEGTLQGPLRLQLEAKGFEVKAA